MVDKEAIATEMIRLDTDTVAEQQEVTEAVRDEQVELDTDGIADRADDIDRQAPPPVAHSLMRLRAPPPRFEVL